MEKQQIPLPQIFDHEQFGQIRVVMTADMPWFVVADVCHALEIINYRDAVARLDDDEKGKIFIPSMGVGLTDTHGGQEMLIVNEFGLYNLILSSRKPEAKKFNRWITHEVLPSLRKYGYYALPHKNKANYPYLTDEKIAAFSHILEIHLKYNDLYHELHETDEEIRESRTKLLNLLDKRHTLCNELKEYSAKIESSLQEFFLMM